MHISNLFTAGNKIFFRMKTVQRNTRVSQELAWTASSSMWKLTVEKKKNVVNWNSSEKRCLIRTGQQDWGKKRKWDNQKRHDDEKWVSYSSRPSRKPERTTIPHHIFKNFFFFLIRFNLILLCYYYYADIFSEIKIHIKIIPLKAMKNWRALENSSRFILQH